MIWIEGSFGVLLSMVCSDGLGSIEYADDRGDAWLEIRPPSSAAFRVPFYGYRTHLIRLVVDGHLTYWLEVLGHCVRSGTFRSLTSGGIDPNLVKPLFDLLNGGATATDAAAYSNRFKNSTRKRRWNTDWPVGIILRYPTIVTDRTTAFWSIPGPALPNAPLVYGRPNRRFLLCWTEFTFPSPYGVHIRKTICTNSKKKSSKININST